MWLRCSKHIASRSAMALSLMWGHREMMRFWGQRLNL